MAVALAAEHEIPSGLLTSVLRRARRKGLAATVRVGLVRIAHLLYLREQHVWYRLDLTAPRPGLPLAPGLELRWPGAEALEGLAARGAPFDVYEAHRLLDGGAVLWTVEAAGEPVFVCWTYTERAPLFAAPGRTIALPEGVVCQDASWTAPARRGARIGPAAWCGIADALARTGARSLIGKTTVGNRASRRAHARAGYVESVQMSLVRIGPWRRVRVEPLVPGATDPLVELVRAGVRGTVPEGGP